jgi:hypothetical protein
MSNDEATCGTRQVEEKLRFLFDFTYHGCPDISSSQKESATFSFLLPKSPSPIPERGFLVNLKGYNLS